MRSLMILILMVALAVPALAENGIQADFEGGNNDAGWRFGGDTIEAEGGNPGGWLASMNLNVPAPWLYCDYDADGWTGDYTAMGVTEFHIDLQTVSTSQQYWSYYNVLVLIRMSNGTEDPEDDIYVYYDPYAFAPPAIEDGWTNYHWDIPTDFDGALGELPANWSGGSYATGNATFPSDVTWQDVMSNVGRLEVWFLDPDYAAIFQWFEMGADNITLVYDQGAVATENCTFDNLKAIYR